MKLRYIIAAAVLAVYSSAAFAFRCPSEMKKIDEALAKNPTLSAAQMADVKKFRAEGEKLHPSNHQASLDALEKAKAILGIK